MTAELRTAVIIGCGRPPQSSTGQKVGWGIGHAHADGYRAAFPDVTLCAVDPNAKNLAAFAAKYSIPSERCFASTDAMYAALLPDAVSICTWPGLHVPQAVDACRRGLSAVIVEKPVGVDVFQLRELDSARGKTRVAVAHQRRYESHFVEAKRIVTSGAIGEKLVIEARIGDRWDMLSWTVHWFDMANFLFDAIPKSVLAGVSHTNQQRYGHAVEDESVVFADYDANRQAVFITGPGALPHFGITVRGDNGMLIVDGTLQLFAREGYRTITPPPTIIGPAYASLIQDLWSTVGNDGVSRCDLSRCAIATEMAFAAHQSAVTQQRMALPSATWYAPLEVKEHASFLQAKGRRIALLADGHHEWPGTRMSGRDGLHSALVAMGNSVTLLDARADLASDALKSADVLVLYHTQTKTPASHRDVVGRWFAAKKPVVVSHCGIGAYADWPEFRRWVGKYWVWGHEGGRPSRHPHVSCTLSIDDATFDTGWANAWLPIDEMYQALGDASAVRSLVTAIAPDGATQCYAWQVEEHPNVVAWLPGHRADMFALPVVRDGLRAAINLATAQRT
jgi:predicted dehydrogenase